ncbi:oligosaccharide flippase family protein [Marivita sp. XM-24bin2]|nr:oligosaccharide flippase family protein [Marivita sp. XM-24bin2]
MTSTSYAPLSLKRNIVFATIGRGYYALTQFLVIVVTSRLGTPEDVGILTLAAAVVTPLFFLTSMGIRDVLTVDDLDRFTRVDYVVLRLAGSVLAVLVAIIAAFAVYGEQDVVVPLSILAFSLIKFFGAQSALNHGLFQRAERLDFVAWSIFARGTAGFLAFVGVFFLTRDLALALFCEAAAWFLTYSLVDQGLLRRLNLESPFRALSATNLRRLGHLTLWVLPIGIALCLTRAATSIPAIVLENSAGLAAVGYFGVLAYAHTAMSMIANTLGSASAARLRRYFREGRVREFWHLNKQLTLLSLGLGLLATAFAWVAGATVLGWVFGSDYAMRAEFTVTVAASGLSLVASPAVTAVTAAQAFRWRIFISGSAAAMGLVSSLILIPTYGVMGAALAFVVTSVVYLAATLIVCWVLISKKAG